MVKEVIRVNTIVASRLKDAYPCKGLETKINEFIRDELILDKDHEYDIKSIKIDESKLGDWIAVIVYSVMSSYDGAYEKTGVKLDDMNLVHRTVMEE